jgi:Flp pilus assembly pilin Flp
MTLFLQGWWINEDGAVASEYVVLISLVAVVAIAGVTLLGEQVQRLYQTAAHSFPR